MVTMMGRGGFVGALAIAALALTGCVRMHVDQVVYEDASISMTMVMAVQDSLIEMSGETPEAAVAEMLGGDFEAEMDALRAQGVDVTADEYRQDGYTGMRMVVGRTDQETLSSLGSLDGSPVQTGSVVREGEFLVISQPGDPSAAQEFEEAFSNPLVGNSIDLRVTYTFPGPVVESSHGRVDGNTVTWDLTDFDFAEDVLIRAHATPQAGGSFPWPLVIAIAALLAAAAVAVVFARRGREALPPSSTPPPAGP